MENRMKTRGVCLMATVTIVGCCSWSFRAWGQDSPNSADSTVQDAIRSMQNELEQLRKDNASMRNQIDDLRSRSEDNWLTQRRADQIRGLVQEVLADADTRASLLNDGLNAGWSDHFFLADPNGKFNLTLEGLMQVRWVYNYHDLPDRHREGFENTRTWLTFRGFVYSPDVQYLVRGDFSRNGGGEGLYDAWIRYNLDDHWSIRAGQFKLPFMREELVYDGYQQAVERSLINEVNSLRRSQGIEFTYGADFDRVSAAFSDGGSAGLSGLNPNRANTPALNEDTEWAVTARYEHLFAGSWDQFVQFTSPPGDEFGMLFGLAGHGQQGESTGQFSFGRNETRWVGYTADLSVAFGGANAFVAWVHNYVDSPTVIVNFYNIMAQAGVYIAPKWEVFIRGEYAWVDVHDQDFEPLAIATLGTNYYFQGQNLKWSTDIGIAFNRVENVYAGSTGADITGWRIDPRNSGADPQIVFRTQFQLLF
jgi:hypothetical protein